ncbi:cytochrome c oxidase subunit 2A [Paenibacillus hemerocallicola]|uniref:Cytochrome c oxidase subunit 2A n=1 Tax=Paenibacillus hemerocallicola TaxID=1172614 RepID=A0A5C4SWZ2_9BACL|nr:cytochrome c oxidase subunit 2A [Paenibacillus hemerocallicola]TNJ58667.1 cytochrome c oxidase subunit 2A [Paenibacillus hemerocallicola]
MAKSASHDKSKDRAGEHGREPSLKGTFAAVMLLGAFLLVTWLGVFFLYLARN